MIEVVAAAVEVVVMVVVAMVVAGAADTCELTWPPLASPSAGPCAATSRACLGALLDRAFGALN